jgi:hypothetical protein
MTYNVRYKVPLPIAMYDGMHQVIKDIPGGSTGLLVHLGWETAEGFEIIEVWESKEAVESFNKTVWPTVVQKLGAGEMPPPRGEEFELRGLVLPANSTLIYS